MLGEGLQPIQRDFFYSESVGVPSSLPLPGCPVNRWCWMLTQLLQQKSFLHSAYSSQLPSEKLKKRWAGSVAARESPFVVLVLSPGHYRRLGTGFLVPCDKFFPAWAPKEVFLLLKLPGNSFTVLLVTQCVPAKTPLILLSPAGQVFSFLLWEAKWLVP